MQKTSNQNILKNIPTPADCFFLKDMENLEEKIKEGYQKNFSPIEFYNFKLRGLTESGENYDFWFKNIHEFFSSGQIHAERMLDIGSGPTVYYIATACAYVPYVVLGDLVEANREQLLKWLRADTDSIEWTPFLERVARAEGRKDVASACKEIESRIRLAVKGVIHCDVLSDQVIAKKFRQMPYDIVFTSLTLETAATNWESYSKILGRISNLLRPEGCLILLGVTGCTWWKVGKNKFHCLKLEEMDIRKALQENGFGNVQWKSREPGEHVHFHCETLYFTTAIKL